MELPPPPVIVAPAWADYRDVVQIARLHAALPKYTPVGISKSRPALADSTVECVAPKSEVTKPSNLHSLQDSVQQVIVFAYVSRGAWWPIRNGNLVIRAHDGARMPLRHGGLEGW